MDERARRRLVHGLASVATMRAPRSPERIHRSRPVASGRSPAKLFRDMTEPFESTTHKIAVVGAGGVGATIAYACLIRGVASDVALYDVDRAKVDAQTLD